MNKVSVRPEAILREHRDWFGNRVLHFNLLEAHDELAITAESIVRTTDAVACGPESRPDPRPWPTRWAEYLAWSPFVPELPAYGAIRHGVASDLPPEGFLAELSELGAGFHHRFAYEAGLTRVDSTPEAFFERGGGVCQDFSHAMIGVLRHAGVPARYASGYLYDPARDGSLRGSAASHAWVQAWHAELGWVGVDPTNRRLVDWQYVRVAIGRDYGDVQPLRGVYHGDTRQELDVHVEVVRLDARRTPGR